MNGNNDLRSTSPGAVPEDGFESTIPLAWRILAEAEEAFGALSMACRRAAQSNRPLPLSIPDFLMWVEDEAAKLSGGDDPTYHHALHELAQELRQLGFSPAGE